MEKVIKTKQLKNFISNQSILLLLLLMIAIMSFVSDSFFTTKNLLNIMRQVSVLGIMACGMTVVIIGAGIDLSIGSILSLVMAVIMKTQPYGYFLSVFLGLITGFICGLINGVLIGRYRANFFMVTLSTLFFYQGITLLVSGGYNLKGSTERLYTFIGREEIFGIPVMIYILLIVTIVIGIILQKTTFGRRLYAVGLNRQAAFAAGVKTQNIVMGTYIISGITAGIAGVVLISRLTMAQPSAGAPYLFDVVTAVVLGGTSLSGGYGNIYKTVLGFIFLGVINNSMALMGIPFEYQLLVKGIIFILAVLYDELMKRRRTL